MFTSILAEILTAVLSLSSFALVDRIYMAFLRGTKKSLNQETYSERLEKLITNLSKSTAEVDSVLTELANVAKDRQKSVTKLESELGQLEEREALLQNRINDLEAIPLPVAEHFANLTAASEKRSATRDYVLFGLGVLFSTIIAIALRALGIA